MFPELKAEISWAKAKISNLEKNQHVVKKFELNKEKNPTF